MMVSHPTKIGKYNIESVIGRGGMGVVYKGVDPQIGRYVAIKVITSHGDPTLLERFRAEARATGSLQCPNIVTVYDFGEQDGNPYLVMQYLEGASLETMIQKGVTLTLSERLGIIIDVCNGLAYAHQRGVIHRDIKPANVMVLQDGVNDGMAMLVDFGIARIQGATRQTATDQIIGSVHYMSAEQLQAKELDNRTDIYSTGVVLFQLLTGALPFEAPETASTLLKIVNEPPPPLSAYIKEYPVELEEIVARALAKQREERYATAKEFALDLMQVQEHLKSETVAQFVRRAEAAVAREEWTKARDQLQQALRIDRQNTQAQKMISAVQDRLRRQQQIEQARVLRSQADEAYMDQRFDDALRLLDQAVTLDPNNTDLQALRESVRLSKERATGLRRALRRAEAALEDGDLDEAESAIGEAFKIDPHDTQAKAIKVIIGQRAEEKSRQEQLQKLLDRARNQIAARDLTDAFATLKEAEALDPTSNELQSVVKMAFAAREQEKRRAETDELRRQIEADLVHENFASAVARAEQGLTRFQNEQSLLKLKSLAEAQLARAEQKKLVREQFASASALAEERHLAQALAVVEQALQRVPGNIELETLRSNLRDRLQAEESERQKLEAVDATIAEAKRLLQEQGATRAREYLEANAGPYSGFAPVQELYRAAHAREVLDALDANLAREPNPARQVLLAEEAARANPDNPWVQKRVADLQQIKEQIGGAIERAERFEAAGRIPDALRVWQELQAAFPQVPEFAEKVRRLASLSGTRSGTRPAPSTPPPARPAEQPRRGESSASSATQMFTPASVPEVPPPADAAKTRIISTPGKETTAPPPLKPVPPPSRITPAPSRVTARPADSRRQPQTGGLLSGSNKYIVVAVAAVVLIVVAYLLFGGKSKAVEVRISVNPPGTSITIGNQHCNAPCSLKLEPGNYPLKATHEGYKDLAENVAITKESSSVERKLVIIPPLGQGTLSVRTNVEGAEIFVDGESRGTTDRKKGLDIKLTEGHHDVSVTKEGYEQQPVQETTVPKDGRSELSFTLNKTTSPQGHFVITSRPGAEVLIDGRRLGRVAPRGLFTADVKPGNHGIEVKLEGYESWKKQLSVQPDARQEIAADLKPAPPPPPKQVLAPEISFTPSSTSIKAGERVVLSWQTQNAESVSIDPGIGRQGKSGSIEVQPSSSTRYTLTATGPGGIRSSSVEIAVSPAPQPPPVAQVSIENFETTDDTIQQGGHTNLIWSVQNATSLSIDHGIGSVLGKTRVQVNPTQATTYTLTAQGPGGAVQRSVTVSVVVPLVVNATEEEAVRQGIRRYQEAVQSMDISRVKAEWPTISRDDEKAMKDAFGRYKALIQKFDCKTISIAGDKAECDCVQTGSYTDKQAHPISPRPVHLRLVKAGGVWRMDYIPNK